MLLFAISIGTATFIESFQNIEAAKILVFNSTWFNLLITILAINGTGIIIKFRMWRKAKRSAFLFHFAFVIILIGAGVSRFTGFEGQMIIKEGTSSSIIYSSEPHLYFDVKSTDGNVNAFEFQKWFSEFTPRKNNFQEKFTTTSNNIEIKYIDFLEDVVKVPVKSKDGIDYLNLIIPGNGGMDSLLIKSGEKEILKSGTSIGFNTLDSQTDIVILEKDTGLFIKSTTPILSLSMAQLRNSNSRGIIDPDTMHVDRLNKLQTGTLYNHSNLQFVFKRIEKKINFIYEKAHIENTGIDVLQVQLKNKREKFVISLEGGAKVIRKLYQHKFDDGTVVNIGYGPKLIDLPFNIECKDFRLENYPGSKSPASFECDVTVHDGNTNITRTIFMNNVLDYKGYRFFQSSYSSSTGAPQINPDTTILSVNHDLPGTIISYLGYFLLAIGFTWNLISKTSRFSLVNKLKVIKPHLRKISVILAVFISNLTTAQESQLFLNLSLNEIENINPILVQNQVGRIGTFQTHAIDVLNKISRSSNYKGKSPTEVYLALFLKGPIWNNEKFIYVQNPDVQAFLQINGKFASINAFRSNNSIDLKPQIVDVYQKSYNKRDSEKTKFDKELIKTIERYFIVESIQQGRDLCIYPKSNKEEKWESIFEIVSQDSISSELFNLNKELILSLLNKGDVKKITDKIIQRQQHSASDYIPSMRKVKAEVLYNKLNIFSRLLYVYGIIGLILLLVLFIHLFNASTAWVDIVLKGVFFLLILLGVVYASGLGLRWYITNHAPWSNGFEALIFVGFACQIAGFIFYKTSKFSMIATTILTSLIMAIAHGANVDPELTNLAPVLKSIWLVIHVAIMTSSYGFLGMGAVLCSINLILYSIGKNNNPKMISTISEFTSTAERTIIVGLFLASIGMFLGGVWANESWGRYWGWDPKETWALIIVLMYAILLHIRMIPSLKSPFLFNVLGVWLYSTVIMTYFGVNYYLVSGLHSYAQGDRSYLPQWAKLTIFIYLIVTIVGAFRTRKQSKIQ